MKPGEHQQLLPVISPENTEYTHHYYSEDDDIAQINENGVITAKKKGNTTIKIFVMSQHGEEYLDLVTSRQVFVSDSSEPAEEETGKESPSGRNEIPAGISPSNPAGAASVDKQITGAKNKENPKGSTFCLLRAKGVAKSKTSVKISWKKVPGAEKYIIYGNRCGAKNRFEMIKKVTGTSFTQKKLKKGTYYKYIVVAVNGDKTLAVSKSVHVVTRGGKAGNARSITTKARKNKVSVKKGKSVKLGAKAVAWSRRLKMRNHRGISYESDNKTVAAVSGKGVIKGVSEGTCNIYVYAQNGVYKKIKVTVK